MGLRLCPWTRPWTERERAAAEERRRARALSRAVAFVGACAVQAIGALALVLGWRHGNPASVVPPTVVTDVIGMRRRAPPRRPPQITHGVPIGALPSPTFQPPTLPAFTVARPVFRRRSLAHWASAATVAAGHAATAQALALGYHPGDGALPPWWNAAWGVEKRHPQFPWSRQPLTSWFDFDFDRGTLVITLHIGRRCAIALGLIVPFAGFGCAVGRLPPDPGRSDLFDRKYLPAPLVLPGPDLPPAPRH